MTFLGADLLLNVPAKEFRKSVNMWSSSSSSSVVVHTKGWRRAGSLCTQLCLQPLLLRCWWSYQTSHWCHLSIVFVVDRDFYCPMYNLVPLAFQDCCASLQRDRSNWYLIRYDKIFGLLFPSLQLGTVTLAGCPVGKSCLSRVWRVSRVCRVSVRVRPAVNCAPRVRAHELPARRYTSAGLCDSDVSVCLSVCRSGRPSVTRRYFPAYSWVLSLAAVRLVSRVCRASVICPRYK